MSQNFFITGANRGLGLAITQVALSEGDTVLAGCRQPEKSEELKKLKAQYGSHLVLIPLDVVSGSSIKEAAVLAAKAVPQIDILSAPAQKG